MSEYEERVKRCGVIRLELVRRTEDGSANGRWTAEWMPDEDSFADYDGSGRDPLDAMHELALVLGAEVKVLREGQL